MTRSDQDQLADFLAERDAECPSCGYNLRGLTSDRCPECNQLLALRVNLAEPRLAAFVTALVGLAAGAGFSGLLLLYFFALILFVDRMNIAGPYLLATSIPFLIQGTVMTALPLLGRRFRRQSDIFRRLFALFAWGLTALNFAIFTLTVS